MLTKCLVHNLVFIALLTSYVLSHRDCQAADLLTPPDNAPSFTLSNVRSEADRFGRSGIAIDYQRTKDGEHYGSLGGHGPDGPLSITGFGIPREPSGTIRLSQMFHMGRPLTDVEFYVTASANWAEEMSVTFLLSNTVRLGNPGPQATARPWTERERAAYEKNQTGRVPPPSLPDDHIAVTKLMTLVPGVPIAAGLFGEWVPAEFLSQAKDGRITLQTKRDDRIRTLPDVNWIAISSDDLSRMKSNPSQFSPSVALLPDGQTAIPGDAVALAPSMKLLVGTPLLLEDRQQWNDVFVLNADDASIKVRYKNYGATWDKAFPKTRFVISKKTLSELGTPSAAETFAANIVEESGDSPFPSGKSGFAGPEPIESRYKVKDYKVTASIPKDAVAVPEGTRIPKGTSLGACWSTWHLVTVLEDSPKGPIAVKWKDYSADAWDCLISRDQLIIEKKVLNKLKLTASKQTESLSAPRTWTDQSGKFKVVARLIEKNDEAVVLETEAGKKLTIPLEKLSPEDQEILAGVVTEPENPFDQ